MEQGKKALSVQKSHDKSENDLMRAYTKKQQQKYNVTNPGVFRVNLGTYGEYDTPADLFYEGNLISIPIDDVTTSYVAGIFDNTNDAEAYQKQMRKRGYSDCFVVWFQDGEKTEF